MARGWESKSVESQIESAESRRIQSDKLSKTPEQLRRQQERESIQLTRTRVLHDIETATHQRHRDQLEAALHHLDEKLKALQDPATET